MRHPGFDLREEIDALISAGVWRSLSELSRSMGISHAYLSQITTGQRDISLEVAIALEDHNIGSAYDWLYRMVDWKIAVEAGMVDRPASGNPPAA